MIILGLILVAVGLVAKLSIITTIGAILVVLGAILVILGATGHAVAGRKYYY